MKTKGIRTNKINIVTLGCSKNLVDSEVLFTQLKGNGMDVTHESKKDDANIVVINTCGFIDSAVQAGVKHFIFSSTAATYGIPLEILREIPPPRGVFGISTE